MVAHVSYAPISKKIPYILKAAEGPKVVSSNLIIGDGHTRIFHGYHGAVGQDYQRSPSPLDHHVFDLVATTAIFKLKFR